MRRVANLVGSPERRGTLPFHPMSTAKERRDARAHAEVRIFREGDDDLEADADVRYWDRIPVDERAELVWRLSIELHDISNPTKRYEPRLSRSVARVLGR